MRARQIPSSGRAAVRSEGLPPVARRGAEGRYAILGAIRLRAWAPILMRVGAGALALVGLAGIGLAASRSPELSALAAPQLALNLAHMAGPALGSEPTEARPPGAPGEPPAAVSSPIAEATTPESLSSPCPKAPDVAPIAGAGSTAKAEARSSSGSPERGLTPDGRVILNLADAVQLQRLPGVGSKRAVAIVQLRQRLGRFRRPSDLLRLKGIGPRSLERMLPHLVLDAPES
jgi:competence protein ComEA